MERNVPKYPVQLESFAKFFHSSICLENIPDRLLNIDRKDAELVVTANRAADIVLSACNEDDLRQAIDEAYSCLVSIDDPLPEGLEQSIDAYVRDPEFPIEIRELLLAILFGNIAGLVLQLIDSGKRTVPPWLTVALKGYIDLGREARDAWLSMTEQDIDALNERQRARERAFDELSRRAADSGQDVFCPFGESDD
jgi:hypothetical protein